MSLDSYAYCPCGSGKKFKWCCEPVYPGIQHAQEQEEKGQHEAALRLMREVVARHEGNPEAWGQLARMLYGQQKVEEAEEALQKAFAINPNYPYGLLLRGLFRFQEGEVAGALLLLRRAVEAYAPDARDYLAEAYTMIYECEQRQHHPLAARAALRIATHCRPDEEALRQEMETAFGPQSSLPPSARHDYSLRSPAAAGKERRAVWDRALNTSTPPRLGDLARLFEQLTREDESDADAWYNLALARAWLGDNQGALEALERALPLESDENAVGTATLMEVLRFGAGAEDLCDYMAHSFVYEITSPEPVSQLLEEWHSAGRLFAQPTGQQGMLFAILVELSKSGLITSGMPVVDTAKVSAFVTIMGSRMLITGSSREAIERVHEEARARLGLGIGESPILTRPGNFTDVITEALFIPVGQADQQAVDKVADRVRRYYEEEWIHRPRRSLSGNSPLDATGSPVLRRKLLGVIRLIEDCAQVRGPFSYSFDNLRRKLGLQPGGAAEGQPAPEGRPVSDMNAAELAALEVEGLSTEQVEQAWQSAVKLDAQQLGAHFARTLIGRPVDAARPDQYPWYSYLIQRATQEGELDAALDLVNEGERVDCAHNEGRRRNDYELRRGQVHTRRGEAGLAQDVFQRLLQRSPENTRYHGLAAEAMLALKQPDRALEIAEGGLAQARKQNDRDSEQYLLELAEAARKRLGS